MAQPRKKILICTPSLEHKGSEVALFNLLAAMPHRESYLFSVYLTQACGKLASALPKDISVIIPFFVRWSRKSRLLDILAKVYVRYIALPLRFLLQRPDYVYVNTITQPHVIALAKKRKIPVFLHVHEVTHMYAMLSVSEFTDLTGYPAHIFACSETVASQLQSAGRNQNLSVVYSSVDIALVRSGAKRGEELRREWGFSPSDYVCLMSGTLDANKNPLRFVELARMAVKRDKRLRFVWIGDGDGGYVRYAKRLAEGYRLEPVLRWQSALSGEDYYAAMSAANCMVLTSDHESLSLVAIEALALGFPVITFANGGTTEIITKNTGVTVPAFDLAACIAAILQVKKHARQYTPDFCKKRAGYFDSRLIAERWESKLRTLTNSN